MDPHTRKEIEALIDERLEMRLLRIERKLENLTALDKELEPFLEGWKGGQRIANFIKWFAGLLIAITAIMGSIIWFIKFILK